MNERLDADAMNAHLSPDTIAEYFSDTLSLDDRVLVAEHVADCDACAIAAQGVLAAGAVVDRWTARAHGQAATRLLLAEALEAARARTTVAAVRERLAAWAEQWAGQAEAALKVVLEAPGRAARVIAEESASLGAAGSGWQLAMPPAPVPTRGTSGRAARRGPPQPVVVTAGGPNGPTARVAVSGDRGEIVVRLDDVPRGEEPPLVLLVPTGPAPARPEARRQSAMPRQAAEPVAELAASAAGAPLPPPEPGPLREPLLGTPRPSPGSDAWIARFEGLGPGDYLIVFEPRP
jgi:hypothetical protein